MLPFFPAARLQTPRLVSSRLGLDPVYGGPSFRGRRPGSRFAIAFELPPTTHDRAMEWSDLDVEDDTCVMPIYQPGNEGEGEGSPIVDGADQAGTTLALKGLTPQLYLTKGRWISIITNGRRYCYRLDADAVADEAGDIEIALTTMLRVAHGDGDVVEITQPKIEGYVTAPDDLWAMGTDRLYYLRFEITEIE